MTVTQFQTFLLKQIADRCNIDAMYAIAMSQFHRVLVLDDLDHRFIVLFKFHWDRNFEQVPQHLLDGQNFPIHR